MNSAAAADVVTHKNPAVTHSVTESVARVAVNDNLAAAHRIADSVLPVTVKDDSAAAEAKGVSHRISSGDQSVISAVYVKVKDGYDIDAVNSRLNGHIRKVTAVRTRSMITGVSDSLAGVSRTVTVLIAAVWVLAFMILLLAFLLIIRERTREFAVLRLAGASRGMLSRMVLAESSLCGLLGGLIGVGIAALLLFPFAQLIESALNLPYLTPKPGTVLLLAAGTVLLSAAVAAFSSVIAAYRLSRVDPGAALREGN